MKLLVAHDGSAQSEKALTLAISLAKPLGGAVGVVSVVPDYYMAVEELPPDLQDRMTGGLLEEARKRLERARAAVAAVGLAGEAILKRGRPVDMIIEAAAEWGAEMIVVGSTGKHGASRVFLGSVSSSVAEQAPVHVLVAR